MGPQWLKPIEIVGPDYEMRTNQFNEGPGGPERLASKWEAAAKVVNKLGTTQKNGLEWKLVCLSDNMVN